MGGVASTCISSACCCDTELWQADATDFGIEELKKRLEGQRKQAKTNPNTEPEIFVTFLEIDKKDGGAIRVSSQKFTLNDLVFRTEVEIHGQGAELAGKAAAKTTDVAMLKMGVDAGTRSGVTSKLGQATNKVAAVSEKVTEKVGLKKQDVRKLKVDITLDMVKEFGHDDVDVTIKDLRTDVAVVQKVLAVDILRKKIESVISEKASEVATKVGRQKGKEFKEKMPTAASAMGY